MSILTIYFAVPSPTVFTLYNLFPPRNTIMFLLVIQFTHFSNYYSFSKCGFVCNRPEFSLGKVEYKPELIQTSILTVSYCRNGGYNYY